MPSRAEYFDDESFPYDHEIHRDPEEEVRATSEEDADLRSSRIPDYPATVAGDDELRKLNELYGFDIRGRFEHSDDEVSRTHRMLNKVYPPTQVGDNVYISKSVMTNHG